MTMSEPRLHINPFASQQVATLYDDWFDTPLGSVVDRLETALIDRMAQPTHGQRALDVGTGTGHFASWLADRGLEVTGLDSSEAMIEVARQDRRVRWELGDATSLPFADNRFHLVLCVTALEFVADPRAALDEMYRVVAPGGRMVVAVLNRESRFGQAYIAHARRADTPFRHARFYTAETLVEALQPYSQVYWRSSVFFAPATTMLGLAAWVERLGQLWPWARHRGALLVGRVNK